MNFRPFEPLLATGNDQPVELRRDELLYIRATTADVEVRAVPNASAKLTIPAGTLVPLGRSHGQTLYVRATEGTVIELAAT